MTGPRGHGSEFPALSPDSSVFLRQGRVLVLCLGLKPAVAEHSMGPLLPPPPGSELHFASVTACDHLQGPTCLRDMIQEPRASSSHEPLPELPPKSRHTTFTTYYLHHFTLVFSKIFYLPHGPQPRHRSTGSWGWVWAAGLLQNRISLKSRITCRKQSYMKACIICYLCAKKINQSL